MGTIALDLYEMEIMPKAQKMYLMRYGWHFSKAAYQYAASLMRKVNRQTGKKEKVPVFTKEEVDALLQKHNVQVDNKAATTMCMQRRCVVQTITAAAYRTRHTLRCM